MEKPNYIDIKKIADFTITKIAVEILKGYSDESITEYLEKYECQSVKELLYLLLCESKPSDLNISLNMRQKIKNISEEVTASESADELLSSQVKNLNDNKDELVMKMESLQELFTLQNQKIQEVMQINSTLKAKLKNQSTSTNLGL